jgi:hypothetical protein
MTEALWQFVAQIVLAHVFSKEVRRARNVDQYLFRNLRDLRVFVLSDLVLWRCLFIAA